MYHRAASRSFMPARTVASRKTRLLQEVVWSAGCDPTKEDCDLVVLSETALNAMNSSDMNKLAQHARVRAVRNEREPLEPVKCKAAKGYCIDFGCGCTCIL